MSQFFGDDAPTSPAAGDPIGSEDYDALADLFLDDGPPLRLTQEDAPPSRRPEPGPPAESSTGAAAERGAITVEALVLGHLPILAGAWAAQHARSLAKERGAAVALARLTADAATVQAVGPRPLLDEMSEQGSLDEAARFAGERCGGVCVRVDATSELDLAASPRVDRVTLLAGTDEASVVAAYRTLKGLKDAMGEGAFAEGGRPVAVRLMGGGEDESRAAEERLRRVAQAFLEMEIEFLPPAPRIDAGAGATLYSGPGTSEGENRFEPFLAMLARADREDDAQTETSSTAEPEAAAGPTLSERVGLTPLGLACPVAPEIELAADSAGGLHLLGVGAASADALVAAEGWAEANRALVGAAAGLPAGFGITARVLTSEPARDRRLLDGRFRVDLLIEMRVGADAAWRCVPLNRADADDR